jgi:predicted thioesterase
MNQITLEIGATASLRHIVRTEDLASALLIDADNFPAVLATSRMIALMEVAAARLMQPLLGEGELSVGVTVDVTHSAATLCEDVVHVTARYLGKEGKLYLFDVRAEDSGGEIGHGMHRRAIIATQRLLDGAARRRNQSIL